MRCRKSLRCRALPLRDCSPIFPGQTRRIRPLPRDSLKIYCVCGYAGKPGHPYPHAALLNSAGIVDMPELNLDAVRAGITLYGLYPSEEVNKAQVPLRPVMELKSHIAYIKTLPAGRLISYGGTYETKKELRVATIPVGYGDAIRDSFQQRLGAHSRKKAPILGRGYVWIGLWWM